ncbi:MAG: pantetheine-phosphate adenylyltransferase [Dehalococcoidia bacterium]|nr:pantetheine-phosphate adenylyltransferase [Dehalococcoidia bacterium]
MTIAVYPGTFDPITSGHADIIKRAASIFDKLIIGVYDKPNKQVLFSVAERVAMVSRVIANLPGVHVKPYSGLTADFIHSVNGTVMIRGLRASSDFEREFEMALMNKKLSPDIELICLMTSSEYQFLSSSLIKEVARLGGCLKDMIPDYVANALKEKFSAQVTKVLENETKC